MVLASTPRASMLCTTPQAETPKSKSRLGASAPAVTVTRAENPCSATTEFLMYPSLTGRARVTMALAGASTRSM